MRPSRANMCSHAICPLSGAFQGCNQIRQISKLQMLQRDHVGTHPRPIRGSEGLHAAGLLPQS